MTPEAECLLATVRHTGNGIPPSLEWPALLDLADSHGLLMLFCRDFPGNLPEEFVSRARSHWTTSAFLAGELQALLREFARCGIEVLPLKGPLMASLLYGSSSQRICDDLDLLVRPVDMPQAKAMLIGLGFIPAEQADDYHHCFLRENTLVELHFAVAPPSSPTMDLDVAWARARVVEFRGQTTRFFAPQDLLIYLVIHGVKHEFARMIWVLDASRALAELNDGEVNEVLATAKSLGIEGALLTTCALAQLLLQVALPQRIAGAIACEPRIAAQAAGLLERMLEGPAIPSTTNQGAELFLRLEPRARARWAQRLRIFRLTQQDYAWAQKYKVNTRWMPFLRPLRLLLKYGPRNTWGVLFSRPDVATRLPQGNGTGPA